MTPLDGLSRAWRWAVRKTLRQWVRVTIKPDDAAATIAARPHPVCYVLEHESQTDLAVLTDACRQLRHAVARAALERRRPARGDGLISSCAAAPAGSAAANPRARLEIWSSWWRRLPRIPNFDVDLVPVAIFWGRAPHKEVSLWRLVFAEDWVLVGRFQKFLNVLFNGRNTLVYFGEPLPLRDALQDGT